ncbi:MAG: hypothetical protein ACFB9M_11895 [Myxococcota bacterium]
MQVQVIRAATRQKALDEAKRRLGSDPLVLSVKRKYESGNGHYWEAVVARELPSTDEPMSDSAGSGCGENVTIERFEDLRRDLASLRVELARGPGMPQSEILALARRLSVFEGEMLEALLSGHSIAAPWLPILKRLEESGYPKAEALRVLQVLQTRVKPESDAMLSEVRSLLGQSVQVAPSHERIRPGMVVFAGAAGVGKTTLAAKLAADLSLGGTAAPLLGVLMPRRGAGTELVRRCARTLGVEFALVTEPRDVEALARRSVHHPVILDSSSINPHFPKSIQTLVEALRPAGEAEVHAVVPSSYSEQDFSRNLSAFAPFERLRLSVTGLDESPCLGRVMAAASRAQVPIGYLSLGPRIPDDLARPSVQDLLDTVFPARMNGGIAI